MKEQIHFLNERIKDQSLLDSLQTVERLFDHVRFSSALGQEDQVISDAIFSNGLKIDVFTLDTGRLFQESYDLLQRTQSKYKSDVRVYFPDTEKVENLVSQKGPNSFYNSVVNRKECCFVRKVEPLQRALKGADVWVTGLRASQSENRQQFEKFEWDETLEMIKLNPLIDWSYDQVLEYLNQNKVPYNPLHDQGYISIGCAPCTRAIEPGEHPRAGRWWWETSQKECGLHQTTIIK